jgi:hypothetical protein
VVNGTVKAKGGVVLVALLALALLSSRASPGFPLAEMPKAVGKSIARVIGAAPQQAKAQPPGGKLGASSFATTDIPPRYLGLYTTAAGTCPGLSWQLLAAIGKVESDHGRSPAPGVRSGLNRAGCCAGPMQFNITNGPPSTWDGVGTGVLAHVYDPTHAIPAAARKLCHDGLANPQQVTRDPCPHVLGTPAQHTALKRYNNACWYVHEIITLASRYTTPTTPPTTDPFLHALRHHPHLTTTHSHGCDPATDLTSGHLDLRVQSLLAVLADRHRIRLSCLRTGHSHYVKGTTRISNHTRWRAVDIDQVDGQPVSAHNPAARALVQWLDRLQGPLRPSEIGSPFPISHRPYFTDEGHQGHIHVGYRNLLG